MHRLLIGFNRALGVFSVAIIMGLCVLGSSVGLASSNEGVLPKVLRPIDNSPQIIINIPEFKLRYYVKKTLVFQTDIAAGSQLSPTRLGDYFIASKATNPTWFPPDGRPPVPPGPTNPLGTRWMGLNKNGYGLHGTIRPSSIGSAASLGCIRMRTEMAEKLYDMVSIGTKVKLVYERILTSGPTIPSQAWVRVLTDIYHFHGERLDNVPVDLLEQRMEDSGMKGVSEQVDEELLVNLLRVSRGDKVYLPYKINLALDGDRLESGAIVYKGVPLVPLSPLAAYLGSYVQYDPGSDSVLLDGTKIAGVQRLAGRAYVSVNDASRLLGLQGSYNASARIISYQTTAINKPMPRNSYSIQYEGAPVQAKAFMGTNGLMIPLRSIAGLVGVDITYDKSKAKIWVTKRPELATTDFIIVDGRVYTSVIDSENMLSIAIGRDDISRQVDISRVESPLTNPTQVVPASTSLNSQLTTSTESTQAQVH